VLFFGNIRWISDSDCTSTVSDKSIKAVYSFRRSDGAERYVSIVFSSTTSESDTTEGKGYREPQ
jgi:hypothetical protein